METTAERATEALALAGLEEVTAEVTATLHRQVGRRAHAPWHGSSPPPPPTGRRRPRYLRPAHPDSGWGRAGRLELRGQAFPGSGRGRPSRFGQL
eukprot:14722398-Alexandrium_andersonii.AAC.1